MCGENPVLAEILLTDLGSPPRVRGKVFQCVVDFIATRITPACAGKRTPSPYYTDVMTGSPPRMRGKELKLLPELSRSGITPAYAGKRVSQTIQENAVGDHPRVCGEKVI